MTGSAGHLVFKMNASRPQMVRMLFKASQASKSISGTRHLLPAAWRPRVSDTIRVTSIVGRFLEHSRIFYFRNGGDEQIYLGSADLMPRNPNRRVEILFPLEDPELLQRVRDGLLAAHNLAAVQARRMCPDGSYKRAARTDGQAAFNSQESLLGIGPRQRKKPRLTW